jgi:GT2 family glycosyltransferase
MKLSIIIPLFNQLSYTRLMYKSLIDTLPADLDAELVFIDDASTDGTSEWLKSLSMAENRRGSSKAIKCIRNPVNLGYAKSNNLAIKSASGDLLVLLNNDLILTKNWLEPMLARLSVSKSTPAIVGNLQYRVDNGQLDHSGVAVQYDSDTNRVKISHCKEIVREPTATVFAVTGACCLIARNAFEAVGGFDEIYVNGGEDIDLCLKISNIGGVCCIANDSSVMHHVSLTRGHLPFRDELNSWNLFKKWKIPIIRELEYICASRLLATLPDSEADIKKLIHDFILGNRKIAPILVKLNARKLFQNEIANFEFAFNK